MDLLGAGRLPAKLGLGSYDRAMPPAGLPFSQRERAAVCDLLSELGPDAPTLCKGWRSADLAAHLVTRDCRLDAAPGMVVGRWPFASWTERAQQGVRDKLTWDELVAKARSGPPMPMRLLDAKLNAVEYFVHHEDLRRASPGWQPRPLAPVDEALLWRQVKFSKFMARKRASRLESPGMVPIVVSKTGLGPVVKGPVGEVVMWLTGRQDAALVEVVDD